MRRVEKSLIGFATVALLAAGPLGLSACKSSDSTAAELSADGMATGNSTAAAGAAGSALTSGSAVVGTYNAADIEFATDMVAHQAQALEMVHVVLRKSGHGKVRIFAKRIAAAETPEIVKLYGWLKSWDQRPSGAATPLASEAPMTGMLSYADLKKLKSASKAQFEIIFLTEMSEHHQGAIAIAEGEIASGINPQAKAFARSIKKSRTAEIFKLNALKASIS